MVQQRCITAHAAEAAKQACYESVLLPELSWFNAVPLMRGVRLLTDIDVMTL